MGEARARRAQQAKLPGRNKRGRHCCRPLSPDLDPLGGFRGTPPAPSGFGGPRHPRRKRRQALRSVARSEPALANRGARLPGGQHGGRNESPAMPSASFVAAAHPCGRLPLRPIPASRHVVPGNSRSSTPGSAFQASPGRACARVPRFAIAMPPSRRQPGFPKAPWSISRHKQLMSWQFPVLPSLAYSRDARMTCESHQDATPPAGL